MASAPFPDQLDLFGGSDRARIRASAATTLLAIGDIHLGRRPSRLPDDLEDYKVSASDLTPAAAFAALSPLCKVSVTVCT